MKKASWLKRVVSVTIVASLLTWSASTAFGQANQETQQIIMAKPQPPMENVFFNVLWGSVVGGLLSLGWATLDDSKEVDERFTVSNMTNQFLIGATYGGFLGLAAGIYLSIQGITFDENKTKIALFPLESPTPQGLHRTAIRSKPKADTLHLLTIQLKF